MREGTSWKPGEGEPEYRQWSAATDLYGAGALALYCLFTSSRQRNLENDDEVPDEYAINSEFGVMLTVLESIPYFSVFWTQLEEVRAVLESLPLTMSADHAATYVTTDGKKLQEMVENAVNNMVQSAPNVRAVLANFETVITGPQGKDEIQWNMAHFVLFMHFVLSCLHRQNHLEPGIRNSGLDDHAHLPFCRTRTEQPTSDGAAHQALERLRWLSDRFKHPVLSGLCIEPGKVPRFDPRSDFLVRLDDKELTDLVKAIIKQATQIEPPWWGKGKENVLRLRALILAAEKTLGRISSRSYNKTRIAELTPTAPERQTIS